MAELLVSPVMVVEPPNTCALAGHDAASRNAAATIRNLIFFIFFSSFRFLVLRLIGPLFEVAVESEYKLAVNPALAQIL